MTRVLVFDGGTLLGDGLASILAGDAALHVDSIVYVDMATLLNTLQERRPDVIILTEESPLDAIRLLDLVEVMHTTERLRIMLIRYGDNTIDLYDKRQVMISQGYDVIDLIHSRPFTD